MSVRRIALVRTNLLAVAAGLLALGAGCGVKSGQQPKAQSDAGGLRQAVQRAVGTAPVHLRVLAARRGRETETVLEVDGTVDLTRRTAVSGPTSAVSPAKSPRPLEDSQQRRSIERSDVRSRPVTVRCQALLTRIPSASTGTTRRVAARSCAPDACRR